MRFYLSTMADILMDESGDEPVTTYDRPYTAPVAKRYGLGLELAEFCLPDNLDRDFARTDKTVRGKIQGFSDLIVHAPYNELSPCSIDRRVMEVTTLRYEQCYAIAQGYGAKKLVVHSGYVPNVYHPVWFVARSVSFWREFLEKHPGDMVVCLENVMETEPDALLEVVEQVDSPRLRLTFDVGHARVTAGQRGAGAETVIAWLERCAPAISHFHIHNNAGLRDTHDPLDKGSMDMEALLRRAAELCPGASFTVECMEAERCAAWLKEKGFTGAQAS